MWGKDSFRCTTNTPMFSILYFRTIKTYIIFDIIGIFSLHSTDEISALKSNDNSWLLKGCVPMITCKSKEGASDVLFCPIVHIIGKSAARHVSDPIKNNFNNRKDPDGIQHHYWTWRGTYLRQANNFEIISCLWKKLAKQLHFHSDLSSTLRFSQQIASKSSTRCSPFVKAVLHPIFVWV